VVAGRGHGLTLLPLSDGCAGVIVSRAKFAGAAAGEAGRSAQQVAPAQQAREDRAGERLDVERGKDRRDRWFAGSARGNWADTEKTAG